MSERFNLVDGIQELNRDIVTDGVRLVIWIIELITDHYWLAIGIYTALVLALLIGALVYQ